MKRLITAGAAVVALLGLAACGERPQELAQQKSGKYQGKPDTQPWKNAQWKDNKAEWENAVKARNQNQNEYTRVE